MFACVPGETQAQGAKSIPVPCDGQRIDTIVVRSAQRSVNGVLRLPIVSTLAQLYHANTRDHVIRDYLLLSEGDPCDEARRAESARILRAQPFLAEATIAAMTEPDGGISLVVQTVDEASLVLTAQFQPGQTSLRAIKVGDSNVDGQAIYLSGSWQDGGRGYRDGYGAHYRNDQELGEPYVLEVEGVRHPLGGSWLVGTAHPFLTDFQRIAWRARAGSNIDYITFPQVNDYDRAVRLDRSYWDAGAILRVGPPGRLALFGMSVSRDDERPSPTSVVVTDAGLGPDTIQSLNGRYHPLQMSRVNAFLGVRDLSFAKVRGFDALSALQDLPLGLQFGTMIGRGWSALGSTEDDIFLASDLYAAVGGERGVLRMEVRGEGRRPSGTGIWDGLLASGRASQLVKLAPNQTTVASLDWAGGGRSRVPFNLALGELDAGVRGFTGTPAFGARRAVARVEQRWVLGQVGHAAVGVAAFVNAGRVWAGDVPSGVTTPVKGAVGVSLLGALPAQSHRLWRIDVTMAQRVSGHPPRLQLAFSASDYTRLFFPEARDIDRARERTVPASIYQWP